MLFNLSRLPERSARLKDLNRFLLLSEPSLSRLTDRLTSRGLVTKESAPGDARGVIIRLTPEGYSEFRRIGRMHADAIERRIDGRFTSDELKTLNELCNRLRSDLLA